jgi:lysozyme family protein
MAFDNARFTACLAVVLRFEGVFVDDPVDPGGATLSGVTQASYDKWRRVHGMPVQPVKFMTDDQRDAIYAADYWLAAHCNEMPKPVDLVVFDAAVQHGTEHAIRFLQAVLSIEQDGKWGEETSTALFDQDDLPALALAIIAERRKYYEARVAHDPSQQRFSLGWTRRCDELEKAIG